MNFWQDILIHVGPALLVIFRIGGLMIFAPILSSSAIPIRVRVLLSFILGLAIYPLLYRNGLMPAPMALDLWTLGPLVFMEISLGMVIGYIAGLPLIAAQAGGLMMGQQMGLGFAQLYNPAIDDEADVLGQLLFLMLTAGFLVIGGHEMMLLAILRSFEHVPAGMFTADVNALELVTSLLTAAFDLSLRIATPVLALIFLQSTALGFVSKTVPQLNILSLGFPVRILVSLMMMAIGLVILDEVLLDGVDQGLEWMFQWIESGAGTNEVR